MAVQTMVVQWVGLWRRGGGRTTGRFGGMAKVYHIDSKERGWSGAIPLRLGGGRLCSARRSTASLLLQDGETNLVDAGGVDL